MPIRYRSIAPGAIKVPVPDTTQETDYTCGASALQAVCKFYGVGPVTEPEFVEHMRMPETGSDPEHLIRGVRRYGLEHREFNPMTITQLTRCLDRGRPVLIMLQAWGGRRSYRRVYKDGHWVVAIGYHRRGVYFEDPSIHAARGFMSYHELEVRWHDWGPNYEEMDHYGLAVWKPGVRRSVYETRARRIT